MNKYDQLADYLSDHLWMRNSLDFDFLKQFDEFLYKGRAYRALYLDDESQQVNSFQFQSFSKTLSGISKFKTNGPLLYDSSFFDGKKVVCFMCNIEGFDVSKALAYFKNTGGLTSSTIGSFIGEEEVLAYVVMDQEKVEN